MYALSNNLSLPPGAVFQDQPEALAEIYQPSINMACWQRSVSADIDEYANFLVETSPDFQLRNSLGVDACAAWLEQSLPSHDSRTAFIDDIKLLADMFSCLFQLNAVGIRLAVLHSAMCPKFHVDYVPCRLLCTYAGAATQWQSSKQAGGETYQQLNKYDVALLKGENWEGNEDYGLIHRSPPASADTGRLVLSLDFA